MEPGPDVPQVCFAIIELPDGLTIAEVRPGQQPEDVALSQGGVLIDPGPFTTYEQALDALEELELEGEEEHDEQS